MKYLSISIMITLLLSGASWAAEGGQPGSYWDSLKARMEKVTPRKKTTVSTAVGGVRSAKQGDTDFYWKGKDAPVEADEDELGAFKKALNSAANGQKGESIALFEGFLVRYPKSQLKDDCLKALEQLKQGK